MDDQESSRKGVAMRAVDDLFDEICRLHHEEQTAAMAAVDRRRRIGELLIEAKKQVQHGEWIASVERSCRLQINQATKYMRYARHFDEIWRALDAANLSSRVNLGLHDLSLNESL